MKKYFFLLLAIGFFLPSYAKADRLFTSGAELNSVTDGVEISSNTSESVTSTGAFSGTYNWRFNPSASAQFARQHIFSANQTNTTSTMGFRLKVVTRPNANVQMARVSATTNANAGSIVLNSSGTLSLVTIAGGVLGSTGVIATSTETATSTSDWHCVELQVNAAANPGTMTARLDGVQFASGNNSAQGAYARFLWGLITPNSTADIRIDDVYINTASTTASNTQTGFTGCNKLAIIRPNAAGDSNNWLRTGGAASSTSNYQDEDEVTPDDATTYTQSNTSGRTNLYNLENPAAIGAEDTINVVQIGGRFANDTADATTAFKYIAEKTSGGTLASSTAIVPNSITWRTNTTAVPDVYPLTMYTDPDGAAWTQSTINSMQAGETITTTGTNNILNSTIWAYIDYTDNAPSPAAVSSRRRSLVLTLF